MSQNLDKKHSDTYCSLVWNHQFIDASGRVKPCCRHRGNLGMLQNDLNDNFNSEYMKTLRYQMSNNIKPPGCIRCWEEENSNKISLRQRYNKHDVVGLTEIGEPKLEWIELAISNECNLMCVMCNSVYSSKLFDEELEYYGKTKAKQKHVKINIESFLNYIPTLKHLKITGGEPFITKDHWRLLDYIIDSGYANNIYINYSTNNTVYPTTNMIERWKHFKNIEIVISLDSIVKEENEYSRYGTKQESVIKNIKRFVELQDKIKVIVYARPTVSILNIYNLPETLEWLDEQNIQHNATHLTDPEHLSITVLPIKIKNMICDKFDSYNFKSTKTKKNCDSIKNYMMSIDNSNLLETFIDHINFLDNKRGNSFNKVYPYFNNLLC